MSERAVDRLHLVLLVLLWGAALAAYATLPERVPHHFNASGEPTSWARTSPLTWFGLPAIAVAMWGFLRWMSGVSERNPTLINIPHKDRFLKLPPERRQPVFQELRRLMAWIALLVTLCFAGIQLGVYETATGRAPGFSTHVQLLVWLPMLATIVVPFMLLPRLRRAIDEAEG